MAIKILNKINLINDKAQTSSGSLFFNYLLDFVSEYENNPSLYPVKLAINEEEKL